MDASPTLSPFVTWELTRRCDARCLYCASASGPGAETSGDLTTSEAIDLVSRLAEGGTQVLTLYGGDPLLRPDWREIVEEAVGRGLAVTVMTNGAVVTDQVADALAAAGVASVSVGIDSHRSDVHDHCRQLPGLYLKALGAVHRLVARGVRVVIGFRPTTLNVGDLRGVAELAHQLGASAVSVLESVPAGRGGAELALSESQTAALMEEIDALQEELRGKLQILAAGPGVADPGGRGVEATVDCGAGLETTHIDPEGKLTPCQYVSVPLAYFRGDGFSQVTVRAQQMHEARLRAGNPSGTCSACSLRGCC